MAKKKPVKKEKKESFAPKFKTHVDIQCGACRTLIHQPPNSDTPKFCWSCGSSLGRFCLHCHKTIPMFFTEWWASREECHRTYAPVRRCPWCRAFLSEELDEEDDF